MDPSYQGQGASGPRKGNQMAIACNLRRGLGLGLLAAFAAGGCIDFNHGDTKTAEDVIEVKPEIVRTMARDQGSFELEGTKLTVTAVARCDVVEMETVETTTTTERDLDDDDLVPVAVLEALSFIPMGAGIALLADAPNVYDDDPNQRLYNETGQGGVIAAGTVLLAVGVLANIWPTVELIRLGVPETDESTTTRQGQVLQRGVACRATDTAVGHTVRLRWAGGEVALGMTDDAGKLVADLRQSLTLAHFQSGSPPVSVGVWLDSQLLGDVGVVGVGKALLAERAQQDDLAWEAADGPPCASSPNEQSCAGVRRYLAAFPNGRHVGDANALLAKLPVALPPPGSGTVTLVASGNEALVQKAVSEALAASDKAMAAARDKHERAAAKAEEAAEKDINRIGHETCVKTCRQVCAADKNCRTRCEEQCP